MEPEFQTPKQNIIAKAKKYAIPALAVVGGLSLVVILLGSFGLSSLNNARYKSSDLSYAPGVPSAPSSFRNSVGGGRGVSEESTVSDYDIAPIPNPSAYVPNLEQYETTDYRVSARTKDFDRGCEMMRNFKADDQIDFKNISESTNLCSVTFYTQEDRVSGILDELKSFNGVEVSRDTISVTRRRENLQTETEVLKEQLSVVESTLEQANIQYTELTEIARAAEDAAALTQAINDKLAMVERLNQKRINLLSRLRNMSQQAADLDERIGVIAFNVSFTRSNPLDVAGDARKWEMAWDELSEAFTAFLIGLSAYLGIFILKVVQYALYALIFLVVVRLGWKVIKRLWRL